ncbi:hypothetical protein MXD60_17215 [Frankia sp. AgB32]|nr:hypothetical protein [Frankia sp. AgB32]
MLLTTDAKAGLDEFVGVRDGAVDHNLDLRPECAAGASLEAAPPVEIRKVIG